MSTKTRPVEKSIAHLDFTTRCEVTKEARIWKWWLSAGACRRKASWMATLPCCGMQAFSCGKHRHDEPKTVQVCVGCGQQYRSVVSWQWRRI